MPGRSTSTALSEKAVISMNDFWKGFKLVHPEDDEVFCIAYGSNLCEARMKERCPEAVVFGTSMIHGFRMLFKKSMTGYYATIEQDANCSVPVLIYRMTEEDEARLDRYEGFPKYYYKREFFLPVWGLNSRKKRNRRNCIAYIMYEYRLLGEPSREYYQLLDEGYERWGFHKEDLEMALINSIGYKQAEAWLTAYRKERRVQ